MNVEAAPPALMLVCGGLALVEEIALVAFSVRSGYALAPQVSAAPPFGVFHDLRWVMVFHSSYDTFAAFMLGLFVVRAGVVTALVQLAWPASLPRPSARRTALNPAGQARARGPSPARRPRHPLSHHEEHPYPAPAVSALPGQQGVLLVARRDALGLGTSWGVLYGLIHGTARRTALGSGVLFGTGRWAMSYVMLVPMGLYKSRWSYEPTELAMDLSYHLAYGAGMGIGYAAVDE